MKNGLKSLFCWNPTGDTLVAFGMGLLVIAVSAAFLMIAAAMQRSQKNGRDGYGILASLFLRMLNREAASPGSRSQEIIEALQIREGWAIADIGSGGGYFTLLFARKAGPGGRVYAVDRRPDYLEFVRRQAEHIGLRNIVYTPATGDKLGLPEASLDLVFVRNVFHHLPRPADYMASLKPYLKAGGRVALIEHKPGGGLTFVSLFKHNTPSHIVSRDMEAAGYSLVESFDFLPGQSFALFTAG